MSESSHHREKPTVDEIKVHIARNAKDREDRNARILACQVEESDCCLSIWANSATEDRLMTQLELAEAGWTWTFAVLCYLNGQPVKGARKVDTTYGTRIVINNEWMPSYHPWDSARKLKNLQDRGYIFKEFNLPAHVVQYFGSFVGAPTTTAKVPDDSDIVAY